MFARGASGASWSTFRVDATTASRRRRSHYASVGRPSLPEQALSIRVSDLLPLLMENRVEFAKQRRLHTAAALLRFPLDSDT